MKQNSLAVQTRIMGVLNVTPDSFSDGGRYLDAGQAFAQFEQLVQDGAEIVDIGAESTRPGSDAVSEDEEWKRLQPILTQIAKSNIKIPISVDTSKSLIMKKAADYGIHYINDIKGGRDKETLEYLAKKTVVSFICMHMHGDPKTMQIDPLKGMAGIQTIDDFFHEKNSMLLALGFSKDRILLDPGFGFGKSDDLNAKIIANAGNWSKRFQLVYGVSRKSFFGRYLQLQKTEDRDAPSKMCEFGLALSGVSIVRTHNVRMLKQIFNLVA